MTYRYHAACCSFQGYLTFLESNLIVKEGAHFVRVLRRGVGNVGQICRTDFTVEVSESTVSGEITLMTVTDLVATRE
jgi:hypothetical protein